MPIRNYSSTSKAGELATSVTAESTTLLLVDPPVGLPSAPFVAIIDRDTTTEEVVLVTNLSGSTLTVERGFDSTPAVTHAAGAKFEHGVTALDFREANLHVNAEANVHGVIGSVAGAIAKAESDAVAQATEFTDNALDVERARILALEAKAVEHDHSAGEGGNIPQSSVIGLLECASSMAPIDAPNFTGTAVFDNPPVVPNGTAANHAVNKSQLDLRAPLESPTFTGAVVVPTGTATNQATNKGQVDAALAAVDLLASSRVRWGNVVAMAGALGNLRITFSPGFASTPRLVLLVGGSSTASGAYVYDGTNALYPAPDASGFWVFGLSPNAMARIYFLAVL